MANIVELADATGRRWLITGPGDEDGGGVPIEPDPPPVDERGRASEGAS